MANTNWYDELKKIDEEDKIIMIATKNGLRNSLEAAKKELDFQFDDGYGIEVGPVFTAWTSRRVYFPVSYDGSEWIDSVPRNPSKEFTEHIGR